MGGFTASLLLPGDPEPLKALLLVEDGRLGIRSGSHRIGEWNLDQVHMERTNSGYRIEVEEEELLLDMDDADAFGEAVTAATPKRERAVKETVLGGVDRMLASAEKSFGSLLPGWVFSRWMFGALVAALIVLLVFPAIGSTLLLIGGLGVVVFGAVVYTDNGLAVKVLPGRMTAMHVLVAGTGTVVFGFLLGVLAN